MRHRSMTGTLVGTLLVGLAHADDALLFTSGEGDFDWAGLDAFAAAHDYAGERLTIASPWLGPDARAAEAVFAYFAAATGADVRHGGSDSFEQQVVIDAEAGSSANIAVFPQPGLVCDMARGGFLAPLAEGSHDWVVEQYSAGTSWAALGECIAPDGGDAFYGFPFGANVKSLVWYVPENFEDAGYEVPETLEALETLADRIVADGGTPWCVGLGSGSATGWPATDWIEDLLLRTEPVEVYDRWIANEIPFDDPRIVAAIDAFGEFVLTDGHAAGGGAAVSSTDFRDSPKGLFSTPPQCYLHRQASFITSFFPEGTQVGDDADFFYFPAYASKDLGRPVLGAGTMFGITKPSEAAHGLIEFLKTPIAHELWMAIENNGFLTPFKRADVALYATDTQRAQGAILLDATTFRFDGSDLMPGAIGAGAFWTAMVDYVGGASSADVAREIRQSWDALK